MPKRHMRFMVCDQRRSVVLNRRRRRDERRRTGDRRKRRTIARPVPSAIAQCVLLLHRDDEIVTARVLTVFRRRLIVAAWPARASGNQPHPIGTTLLFTVATVLALSSTIQSWRLQMLTDKTWMSSLVMAKLLVLNFVVLVRAGAARAGGDGADAALPARTHALAGDARIPHRDRVALLAGAHRGDAADPRDAVRERRPRDGRGLVDLRPAAVPDAARLAAGDLLLPRRPRPRHGVLARSATNARSAPNGCRRVWPRRSSRRCSGSCSRTSCSTRSTPSPA